MTLKDKPSCLFFGGGRGGFGDYLFFGGGGEVGLGQYQIFLQSRYRRKNSPQHNKSKKENLCDMFGH